ncbi:MAG: MarR family transcriptional regulator [Pseudomonadota bacterium]
MAAFLSQRKRAEVGTCNAYPDPSPMVKSPHTTGIDVPGFLDSLGLRHAYRLSYVTSAIVTPGYEAVKRETGLIRGEYLLLLCLDQVPVLTAQDVARLTRRPRNSISRAVHRMVAEGYINRAPDPSDGRQSRLNITDKGRETLSRAETILASREDAVFSALDAQDHRALDVILRKLTRHAAGLAD